MASLDVCSDVSGFVDNWQSGKSLAECNLHMLTSEDSTDVSFRVGRKKIVRAHRYVLISRSCVFHAMLCGPLSEKDNIKIADVEEDVFVKMLRYLYTNDTTITPESVTGLLYLSKKYAVGGLERQCLTYLNASLSPDNACIILEQAHGFHEEDLHDKALKVILQNGEESINNPDFKDLCHECLDKVVKSESLGVNAMTVFRCVVDWTKAECTRQGKDVTPENQRLVLGATVFDVPFTAMSAEQFAKHVVPSCILTGEECTKLFCYFSLTDGDAAPFKVKSKQRSVVNKPGNNYQEVSLYSSTAVLCEPQKLDTWIILTPSRDLLLGGFKVYASSNKAIDQYRYRIKIENLISGYYYNTTLSGKLMFDKEIDLQLSEPCFLAASTRYRVHIETLEGESGLHGKGLIPSVGLRNSYISVSYSDKEKYKKGLISKIIVEEV